MPPLRRALYRIRQLFRRPAVEASMDAEMRYHIECETNDRIARGMSPGEARRTAIRDFGGVDTHKEAARDERGFRALEEFLADARYALRTLSRNPSYTIAAGLTFALGAGLTTAIFSVVHGVLLRPLPYVEPERLAVVWERNAARGAEQNVTSVATFEAWRGRNRSFTALAGLVPAPATLGGSGSFAPERVAGAEVSPGYFHLLGARPAIGRDFSESDGIAGAEHVVILGDIVWRTRFGADRSIVGRTIALDDKPFTVIGVMPADFDPPRFGWLSEQQLWLPFAATQEKRSWGRFLLVVGRLRDGVSLDAARRDMVSVADAVAREDSRMSGWSASVVPLAEQITGDVRKPLLVLMGAVALLLLMAATNVGSLTLGFLRRRDHELAVRQAIGASRARVFRQMATHSLVLGAMGWVAGVATAIAGTRLLLAFLPPDVPRVSSIQLDGTTLLFASGVAMIVAAVIGVVTSVRALSAQARTPAIAHAAVVGGRATKRLGSGALVIAEIALGVVLTVFAGLMLRSFANLRAVPLGFDASNVVAARVSLPPASYDTDDRQRAFFERLGERVRAIPGVQSVGFATTRPFACCAPQTTVTNPEQPLSSEEAPSAFVRFADSSYFAALRIPVVAGSGFSSRERADGQPRVLINQTLARKLWRGASPVGRAIDIVLDGGIRGEIAGVVGDVHLADARTPPQGTVYLTTERYPSTRRDVVIRAERAPDAIVAALREALRSVDPTLPLYQVTTLAESVDLSFAQDRFTTLILSVFAIVALLLAAVGIYGVFAAEVTARHKEIGVRLALGARGSNVLLLVIRRALALSGIGAALGVALGLFLSRSLSALVFDVATSDPASFAGVAGLLLTVAMLATVVPAVRAARVSPLDAIRSD